MRKRLQRAAAIGMAAIISIQNAQFGLTTFADELSDFARLEGIMNAQAMRMTPDGWFVREDGSWDEKR